MPCSYSLEEPGWLYLVHVAAVDNLDRCLLNVAMYQGNREAPQTGGGGQRTRRLSSSQDNPINVDAEIIDLTSQLTWVLKKVTILMIQSTWILRRIMSGPRLSRYVYILIFYFAQLYIINSTSTCPPSCTGVV
ncbi:hypothetical protein AFLA70_840g000191 [Aspergillus flavus AF70]|nr:hypothetical protein AFLA70_840g000191 [Aspergillus flavus AF70]